MFHFQWLASSKNGGSDGKESVCIAGDLGSIPGSGRSPGEENGYPFQYSCLEESHGQSSLMGYSPWGRKESDMTEWLSLQAHFEALLLKGRDCILSRTQVPCSLLVYKAVLRTWPGKQRWQGYTPAPSKSHWLRCINSQTSKTDASSLCDPITTFSCNL